MPSQKYMQNTCFDMEGYSFCTAASKFSLSDYIQVVKIISDNEQKPVSELRKSTLQNAIASGSEETINIIEAFLDLRERKSDTQSHLFPQLTQANSISLNLKELDYLDLPIKCIFWIQALMSFKRLNSIKRPPLF